MILTLPNGQVFLPGGKPLKFNPVVAALDTIDLVPFVIATGGRFNVQPTAASGDTAGYVPVVVSYTGGDPQPGEIQARIVDTTAGSTAVPGADWAPLQNVTFNSATKTALGYVPDVREGVEYKRQVRIGATGTVKTDTTLFNVGQMVLSQGQSNGRGTLDGGSSGGAKIPGSTTVDEISYFNTNKTGAIFGPSGNVGSNNSTFVGSWGTNYAGGLSLLRILGARQQAKTGRKTGIAINPWVQNGTPMSGFMSSAGVVGMLSNAGTTNGTVGFSSPANYAHGDFRAFSWHQGESEPTGVTRASRFADLKKLCEAIIAQVGKAPYNRPANKVTILFAVMGLCGYNANGTPTHPHMELLRAAVYDIVAYGATQGWDVRIGWNCIDLDPLLASPPDSIHFGLTDQRISSRRLTQAFQHVLDPVGTPYGAEGPRLTGATSRAGDVVTLTVAQSGGSGLAPRNTGAAITGWYANTAADFSGTEIALTNVTVLDATHVQVTAAGAQTTFYIKHCGHRFGTALSSHPDVSNMLYDNFTYPTGADPADQYTGLPLQPTPDAIKVGP